MKIIIEFTIIPSKKRGVMPKPTKVIKHKKQYDKKNKTWKKEVE